MARRAAPHRGLDVHYGEAEDGDDRPPSKSALKRQSTDLQKLGQQLADLSADQLKRIEMPENLREAIHELRRTKSHEGRRRQLQFVGKLMRGTDEAPLREALAATQLGTAEANLQLHTLESWRTRLMSEDDAMTEWLATYPETDSQQLRALVRQARKDAAGLTPEARQPKSFRELFQFIKPFLV